MWRVDIREPPEILLYFQRQGAWVGEMEVGSFAYKGAVGFVRFGDDFLDFEKVISTVERMKREYPVVHVFVDGDIVHMIQRGNSTFRHDVTSNVVGLVASLCMRGTPPMFTSNPGMAVLMAERIVEKTFDGKEREWKLRLEERKTSDVCTSVLLGFPGMKPSVARRISEFYHGNVRSAMEDVLHAPSKLAQVDGVGDATIESIKKVTS